MNGLLCVAAIAVSLVAPNLAINCSDTHCMEIRDTHTMCKYPDPNPAPACGQVFSVGLTADEKTEIISKHNELRQFVAVGNETRGNPGPQPISRNMNILFWDDELAEIAQRWANQCSYGNDDCRDVARFVVGQNCAMMRSKRNLHITPSDVLMKWYNEVQYMDRQQTVYLTSVYKVDHYTQMVWAITAMIGCGKIVYRADGWNRYYMVCNYGPAGNFMGQAVYIDYHD